MPDIDTLLQENLERLEEGTPLTEVLAKLPAEAAELRSLIEMAAAVQSVDHPEIPESRQLERRRQLVAAGRQFRMNGSAAAPFWRGGLLGSFSFSKALGLLLLVGVLFVGTNIWMAGPPAARAAELIELTGNVEVASQEGSQNWQQADQGAKLHSGMVLRTGIQASATLKYFDGSWTKLGPETEIILTQIDGYWWDIPRVALIQPNGQTTHYVAPFNEKQGGFEVSTAAGNVQVIGTRFQVSVLETNEVRINAEAGKVEVSNADGKVDLNSGIVGTLVEGFAPEVLGYPFLLQDHLTAVLGSSLVVADIPVRVSQRTTLEGAPMLGDVIKVQGYVRPDGEWVADHVTREVTRREGAADFIGILETINEDLWQIGGETVLVNETTEIESTLTPGMIVRVEFAVLDGGRWQALKITRLEDEQGKQEGIPPDHAQPELPCSDAESRSAPQGIDLSERYGVTHQEILSWFCQGYGFGEIDLAYSLSSDSGLPVENIFLMRQNGLGWGNVRNSLLLTTTQTITATMPFEFDTGKSGTENGFKCSINDIHPTGKKLAERYNVPYEEIMERFCQGYGFGEIDLAYTMSHDSGEAPERIFEENKNGKGWGEIRQELRDEKQPNNKGPEKDKHNENP